MPVADRESHVMVRRASDAPYGCKDREIKSGYWSHQRKYYPDGRFSIELVFTPHRMSTECRYDKSLVDPRCGTCSRRGTGEECFAAVEAAAS